MPTAPPALGVDGREEPEVHVHRLEGLRLGPAGDVGHKGAHRGFRGWRGGWGELLHIYFIVIYLFFKNISFILFNTIK